MARVEVKKLRPAAAKVVGRISKEPDRFGSSLKVGLDGGWEEEDLEKSY